MTATPTIVVTPRPIGAEAAAQAYATVGAGTGTGDFGAALGRAVSGAIDTGHTADAEAMQAIAGKGNLTDVVTAVSKAELTLQTTVAIRDRVVQAYQDIMRMPI